MPKVNQVCQNSKLITFGFANNELDVIGKFNYLRTTDDLIYDADDIDNQIGNELRKFVHSPNPQFLNLNDGILISLTEKYNYIEPVTLAFKLPDNTTVKQKHNLYFKISDAGKRLNGELFLQDIVLNISVESKDAILSIQPLPFGH